MRLFTQLISSTLCVSGSVLCAGKEAVNKKIPALTEFILLSF